MSRAKRRTGPREAKVVQTQYVRRSPGVVESAGTMFCPECKAEYRQGFTHCADCDVELVAQLPNAGIVALKNDAGDEAGEGVENPEDPFCQFWRGEDARILGELCDVLAEAAIPFRKFEWQDHLFNRTRFPEFRLAIPFSMFERAERAVGEAYGGGEEADDVMHPTEENRAEYRKLLAWPLEKKLRGKDDPKWKTEENEADESSAKD